MEEPYPDASIVKSSIPQPERKPVDYTDAGPIARSGGVKGTWQQPGISPICAGCSKSLESSDAWAIVDGRALCDTCRAGSSASASAS